MYNNTLPESLCMGCMEPIAPNTRTCPHCGYLIGGSAVSPEFIAPESIIYDRYIVGRVLSSDRFGIRYMAFDTALDCKVILTCAIPEKNSDQFSYALNNRSEMIDAIKQRSSDLKNIRGLITPYEVFTTKQELYTVRRYTDCLTLKEYVNKYGGRIPYRAALKILKKAAGIVHKMHRAGIIHCGISPDNILVGNDGEVFVVDGDYTVQYFSDNPVLYLRSGFAPIELYNSDDTPSTATDVYSIAACLYYAIMGRPLPSATDRESGYDCPAPSIEGIDMPGTTEQVMINALETDRSDRIGTLDELFMQLKEADPASQTTERKRMANDKKVKDDNSHLPGYFKYIVLGIASALLIFVCLLVAGVFDKPTDSSTVPSIVGMSVDEAKTELADAGFVLLITDAENDGTYPAGTVIKQDQNAATAGDFITATVSLGMQAEGTIPNTQYDKLSDAFSALKKVGTNVTVTYAESDDIMIGNVISQSVEPGASSESIQLVVSSGSANTDSRLSASKTVTSIPAYVVFITQNRVWEIGVTEKGKTLYAMPSNPAFSDPTVGMMFADWNTLSDGSGSPFTAQSICSGIISVYARFTNDIEGDAEATISPELTPTVEPTEAVPATVVPTVAPIVTQEPTQPPVQEPTMEPTEEPTQAPVPTEPDQDEPAPEEPTDDVGESDDETEG